MDNRELYVSELEHLKYKLNTLQTQFSVASDKIEKQIFKEKISILSAQIKIAEESGSEILNNREFLAKIEAEEKEKAKEDATYNNKLIFVGRLIIGVTILLCIISLYNAIRMQTYVSAIRSIIGFIIMLSGVFLFFGGPSITGKKLSVLGAICLCLGGILMGIGSTVSSDAKDGSPVAVIFGMLLISAGVIIIVVCYWSSKLKKKF